MLKKTLACFFTFLLLIVGLKMSGGSILRKKTPFEPFGIQIDPADLAQFDSVHIEDTSNNPLGMPKQTEC